MKKIIALTLCLCLSAVLLCSCSKEDGKSGVQGKEISMKNCRPGDIVSFGAYPQGKNGEVYAIEWLVLDVRDGKALLLSRYGLDAKPYHNTWKKVTWKDCSLRAWLNSSFMQNAFTSSEQNRILLTDVDNSAGQGFNYSSVYDLPRRDTGGADTQDQLFLLSYAEAYRYMGGISHSRESMPISNMKARVQPTDYAIARGAYSSGTNKVPYQFYTEDRAFSGEWWLRSPGYSLDEASMVGANGYLGCSAVDCSLRLDLCCVRPAMWISLQ